MPGSTKVPPKGKFILILAGLTVFLICGLYLNLEWNRYQAAASSEAIQLAQSIESLLHKEHIAELTGGPEDIEKNEYIMTKLSLKSLVEATNPYRFAYLMKEKGGEIIFLVDSESPDSPDYSPPGQIYSEADDTLRDVFRTGKTVLTDPTPDRWGTWISALVPINDPLSGETTAILGLDYSASEWRAELLKQMIPDFIIVFFILILFLAVLYIFFQNLNIRKLAGELALDKALYQSVFDQAPLGIAIVNNKSFVSQSELGKTNINPMFENILGRTSSELDQLKWSEITHQEDLQADLEKFEQFKRGEITGYSMEKRFIRPDGSIVWTNMKVSPLLGLPTTHSMHLCLLEDISARKEMEKTLREIDRRDSLLLSHLPGLAYRCKYDRDGTMQIVSDGCFKLTGYLPECFLDNRDLAFNDIIKPEHRELLLKEWERTIPNKLPYKQEYEITTANGERKWVLEMGEGVYKEQGEVEALEGIILDITERKKAEEEHSQLLLRTQSAINNHEAVMLFIEPVSGQIVETNAAACTFYGYSKEELLNMTIQDINTLDRDELAALRMKALNKEQKHFTFPHRLKSGEIRTVDTYSCPVDFGGRKVLFSILFDVTKREEIARQNEYLAFHDFLTGLYNRRFFEEEFKRRVDRGDFPIAVLLGDLDAFKVYNDAFGHVRGDELLKETANRIKALVHDGDVLARVGGDEFAVIVSGKSENEIRQHLDELNKEFDFGREYMGLDELITVSWGYGIQREKGTALDETYNEAETFMHNRKYYSQKSRRSKTVNVIMKTLFTKSEREERHSERVGKLCEAIARGMNMSQQQTDKIRVAGFLHDIGKIGIDEATLNKPGKLEAHEWDIMKLHPAKGASILEETAEYKDIADIVLSHHERYDGLGYPRGLKADAIPLEARIIALADAFDALTSERPYKKAVGYEQALNEIKNCSGTQFDPEIVSVFIDKVLGLMKTDEQN